MSLRDKLKKNTIVSEADFINNSEVYNVGDPISTYVPCLNIALSGELDGGIYPGVTMIAAPSKHFKSALALTMAKAYLDKYDDSMLLFYDSEFGTPPSYFESFGIDMNRVFHVPLKDVENLKADFMNQVEALDKNDHLIVILDSLGQLPSVKEINDSLKGNAETVDMTRAKQIKSFFRMINTRIVMKKIPIIVVNHVYSTLDMYSKPKQSGGSGGEYTPNSTIYISRSTEKDKTSKEVLGYTFKMSVEKSRFVKEGSVLPLQVSYNGGINKYSGLLELAIEAGFVDNSKQGWYAKIDQDTGEIQKSVRRNDTNSDEFWKDIINDKKFKKFVSEKFKMKSVKMLSDEEINETFKEE